MSSMEDTLERIGRDLRERYPDPEERWIAAHRELKGETKTHEDYIRMRRTIDATAKNWEVIRRLEERSIQVR